MRSVVPCIRRTSSQSTPSTQNRSLDCEHPKPPNPRRTPKASKKEEEKTTIDTQRHTHTGGNGRVITHRCQVAPRPQKKHKPRASLCASQEKGHFPSLHGTRAKTQPLKRTDFQSPKYQSDCLPLGANRGLIGALYMGSTRDMGKNPIRRLPWSGGPFSPQISNFGKPEAP